MPRAVRKTVRVVQPGGFPARPVRK